MATQVNVTEAKTNLSRLLEKAIAGEEVIIMRSGRPMVRLTPVETAPFKREFGTAKGQIFISDDFDDPLPEEILAEFEK
jgi:prevent-host-death family protein